MSDEMRTDRMRIAAYVAGGGTPNERAELAAWISADPGRQAELAAITRIWGAVRAEDRQGRGDLDTLWSRIAAQVHERADTGSLQRADPQPVSRRRPIIKTFVTFAACLLVAFMGWQQISRSNSTRESQSQWEYTTGNGQRADITLPDGSTVSLNVASRIEIAPDFASGNRVVRLTGEAIFNVAHRNEAPLTIMAGPTTARVLGTTLIVRHYPTDDVTTVAVRDGKVGVQSLVLTAGQRVDVHRNGRLVQRSLDPAQLMFAAGTLVLDTMPLPNAILELNRWYDADIQLGDPQLSSRGIGGKFAVGSVTDLVAILEWTADVRVVRNGRRLTLYPNLR